MIWGTTFEDTTISQVLFIISLPVRFLCIPHLFPIYLLFIPQVSHPCFQLFFPHISTYFPSYSQLTGQQAPYVGVAKIWRTAHPNVLRDTTAFHEIC